MAEEEPPPPSRSPASVRPMILLWTQSSKHSSQLVTHGFFEGGGEFMFQQNRPDGLVVSEQIVMLTLRPRLSPASLLDSPEFFPHSLRKWAVLKLESKEGMTMNQNPCKEHKDDGYRWHQCGQEGDIRSPYLRRHYICASEGCKV
ncbi:unnamed protein product [Fraxinus pennsylvanica]|uniref:WRKY domain-containing protein n=1 Tax=Fraxinus pennsylvanica TaxID=56036 RepID=A0AAD2DS90_9LAMI|nr:unnamed protein product [Fraxinus pennsylvanica]